MSGVKRWDHAVRWEGMKIAASYMEIKSGGKYVLASDYDRDMQALRDDYNEACADAMQVAGKLQALEAERDALRAQVEAMRELLAGVCDYADDLLTDVNRAWSYCGSTGADEVHKDADYLAARAALQAKP